MYRICYMQGKVGTGLADEGPCQALGKPLLARAGQGYRSDSKIRHYFNRRISAYKDPRTLRYSTRSKLYVNATLFWRSISFCSYANKLDSHSKHRDTYISYYLALLSYPRDTYMSSNILILSYNTLCCLIIVTSYSSLLLSSIPYILFCLFKVYVSSFVILS